MSGLRVGFTGTQRGITPYQAAEVRRYLQEHEVAEFHHGDCVGADSEAHTIAQALNIPIIIHPPLNPKKRAQCNDAREIREEKGYLERNHDIVDEADILIATPGERVRQLRSGTWATIRYAERKGVPRYIIYPHD